MFRRNVVEKIKNTRFVSSNQFLFFENRAVYEKMWGKKNILECVRSQKKIWRMRIACWITKATNKHSGCVTLIAFPGEQQVAQTRLNVTLYPHCMAGYLWH